MNALSRRSAVGLLGVLLGAPRMTLAQKAARALARGAARKADHAAMRIGRLRSMSPAARRFYIERAYDDSTKAHRMFANVMGWDDDGD